MLDGTTTMSFTGDYLFKFLQAMVLHVGMAIIQGPVVYERLSPRGFDGWVILAESHAAIHTYGERVMADVFSCMPFDTEAATEFIRQRLKFTVQDSTVVERAMPFSTAEAIGRTVGGGIEQDGD